MSGYQGDAADSAIAIVRGRPGRRSGRALGNKKRQQREPSLPRDGNHWHAFSNRPVQPGMQGLPRRKDFLFSNASLVCGWEILGDG